MLLPPKATKDQLEASQPPLPNPDKIPSEEELSLLASRLLETNCAGEPKPDEGAASPTHMNKDVLGSAVQAAFELWTASHQFLEAYKSTRANGEGAFCHVPTSMEYRAGVLLAYWRSDAGQRGLLVGIDHFYRSLNEFEKFDRARYREEAKAKLRQRFGETAALQALCQLGFGNGNEWQRADQDLKDYLGWLSPALRDLFRPGLESPEFRARNAPFVDWDDAPHFVDIVEGKESAWKLSVFRGEPEKGPEPKIGAGEEVLEIRI